MLMIVQQFFYRLHIERTIIHRIINTNHHASVKRTTTIQIGITKEAPIQDTQRIHCTRNVSVILYN